MKERIKDPLPYESERQSHMRNMGKNTQTMKHIREALFDRDPSKMESPVKDVGLRTPKEARKEVESLRDQLAEVRDYKE